MLISPATMYNLMDVDFFINSFIKEREQGITTLHRVYYQNNNELSLRSFKEELIDELRTGCVTFLNKNADITELNSYLFYIVNAFCKKNGKQQVKQNTEYICPGCVYLGKEYFAINSDTLLQCDECKYELKIATDPKKITFFKMFYKHNKRGYHCKDCQRFIPHPLDNSSIVSCPYFDCLFVGNISDMQKIHHTNSKSNPEKIILYYTN